MGEIYFNKRGQLALFVIFGVLIVVGLIALFMALPSPEILDDSSSKNPMQEIRPCISKSLEDVLPEYLEKGLYFNSSRKLMFEGKDITYHCYTDQKRAVCFRNDAQSKSRIEEELKNKIMSNVEQCFSKFRDKNKAYNFELGQTNLSIEVIPGKISIKTRKDLVISRAEEEPIRYNNFDVAINSPLFDFMRISNDILNEEVSCNCPVESCTADISNINRLNRGYTITHFMAVPHNKVYFIEDLYGNKIKFAVKNCDKTP